MSNVQVKSSVAAVAMLSPVVHGLATIATNKIAAVCKSGIHASVAMAALLIADQEFNGTDAIGRRKLTSSIKARMVKRGEIKSSCFDTYMQMGHKLVVNYGMECILALNALKASTALRNSPITAQEAYDTVHGALSAVPGLLTSMTALRAATIGGVPSTADEKERAKVRAMFKSVNVCKSSTLLDRIGGLALLRAKVLAGGVADTVKAEAEIKAVMDAIAKEFAAVLDDGDETETETEATETEATETEATETVA